MEDWDGELCVKCWGIHPNQDDTYSFYIGMKNHYLLRELPGL